MTLLSQRILNMEESATLAMAAKARELKAQGIEVISLSLGEPDFLTPDHIREAGEQAIREGKWFTYPPVAGYPDLREAIAQKLVKENNIPSKAENIVVSAGAKQSIANVMMCLLNPGDEVVVFSPFWVSYAEIIKLAEGIPVFIHAGVEQGYKATSEQLKSAISTKTKAVIFSSPCNPTGAVFSEEELRAVADVVAQHPDVYIIADEIYEHINFTGKHFSIGSIPSVQSRVITVNGFSKGFAMTGWRVGYISAPKDVAKACEKIQGQFTSGICSIAQRAAFTAISSDLTASKQMAETYLRRKKLVMDLLAEIPGLKMNDPQGAFYAFPDVSHYFGKKYAGGSIDNADDLAMYFLNEGHVSTVTGAAFGAPECIRISFAAADQDLVEALKRIKELLVNLS
jgi:aspartate aminotransferase